MVTEKTQQKTLKEEFREYVEINFHECSEDMKNFIVGTAFAFFANVIEQKRQDHYWVDCNNPQHVFQKLLEELR